MIRALALVAYLAYLAAPATAKELTNGEKARLLRAFAAPQLAALQQAQQIAEASRAIPSFGACVRTTEVEQTALTKRVSKYVDELYPKQKPAELMHLVFGCVQPAGIIVDIQTDGIHRGERRATAGHSLVVRVGKQIAKLAERSGGARGQFMEWTREETLETLALADLDGDGVLDPIIVEDSHEGGALVHELTLGVIASKTGQRTKLAELGDRIIPIGATGTSGSTTAPVLSIESHDGIVYRCVTATALGACPEAAAARRAAAALAAARELASVRPELLPDRDLLAGYLELLSAPEPARAQMLGDAVETTEERRVTRELAAWVSPPSERTHEETLAVARTVGEQQLAEVRRALGDTTCTPKLVLPEAKLVAWVKQHASELVENGQPPVGAHAVALCGGYAWMTWGGTDGESWALLYTQGERTRRVLTEVVPYTPDPSGPQAPRIVFHLENMTGIGLMITAEGKRATVIANGQLAGTREGNFVRYEVDGGLASDAVIVDVAGDGAPTFLHATAAGLQPVTTPALLDHVARRNARAFLDGFDAATGDRHAAIAAMKLAGAPPALIAHLEAIMAMGRP